MNRGKLWFEMDASVWKMDYEVSLCVSIAVQCKLPQAAAFWFK
jgi:hypothetical protein